MSIKPETKKYVKCDFCEATHPARESTSYNARVKAGVDGWVFVTEGGKGGKALDYCPTCANRDPVKTNLAERD